MSEENTEKLIKECKQIEEDSLYTSEVHYIIGSKLRKRALKSKFIPLGITVLAAFALVLSIVPNVMSWITLVGALISMISIILDPDKESKEHFTAAKEFTAMKHEARSLHEAFSSFMNAKEFLFEVRCLRDKYDFLAKNTPATDDEEAFQQARKNIQEGRHMADFREREYKS